MSSLDRPLIGPSFVFTELNKMKPAMIAQATAHAREATPQLMNKVIRAVATVEYLLKD